MSNYDYVIIGSGPSGLTLGFMLGYIGKKCLIIDKNDNIGGCHRVLRVDGLFTEHGPRIYSNSYINTIKILKKMGIKFSDIFTPYNFNISNIGGTTISNLRFTELLLLTWEFIADSHVNKKLSMNEYMNNHDFSTESRDYINRLCLLTDGADASRYTLFEFLELANQQLLYKIYQPKKPNDQGLFPLMSDAIKSTGNVDILLNTEVVKLNISTEGDTAPALKTNVLKTNVLKKIISIEAITSGNTNPIVISSNNFILAIPPKDIIKLTRDIPNVFGTNTELIASGSSYNNNIPVIFHWDSKINLEKIWGFPKSNWGIAFIILSDYMDFSDDRSQTVISTCITLTNNTSSVLNKTSNQVTDKNELVSEVFRQLKESFPTLPNPTYSILSPTVYRNNNEWLDQDSAFVRTPQNLYLPTHLDHGSSTDTYITNLYNVGTQNGNSPYNFTSFESAVSNSISFVNTLIPHSKKYFKLHRPYSLRTIVRFVIILLILLIIIMIFI